MHHDCVSVRWRNFFKIILYFVQVPQIPNRLYEHFPRNNSRCRLQNLRGIVEVCFINSSILLFHWINCICFDLLNLLRCQSALHFPKENSNVRIRGTHAVVARTFASLTMLTHFVSRFNMKQSVSALPEICWKGLEILWITESLSESTP